MWMRSSGFCSCNYSVAILFVMGAIGRGGVMRSQQQVGHKRPQAAKIIEFYIPTNFRWKGKWITPQNRGKIIEFSLQKKSA